MEYLELFLFGSAARGDYNLYSAIDFAVITKSPVDYATRCDVATDIADYGDDGVSQKATVKTGLASKSDAIIPSPVTLKPYRTFTEVEQPESQFVFRMKEDKYDGVQCALFEADGGAWKLHAMESIQEYLEEQLKGVDGFTIIS